MGHRILAGKKRGEGGNRPTGGTKCIIKSKTFFRKSVDIRRGVSRIAITSKMVRSERIDCKNDQIVLFPFNRLNDPSIFLPLRSSRTTFQQGQKRRQHGKTSDRRAGTSSTDFLFHYSCKTCRSVSSSRRLSNHPRFPPLRLGCSGKNLRRSGDHNTILTDRMNNRKTPQEKCFE